MFFKKNFHYLERTNYRVTICIEIKLVHHKITKENNDLKNYKKISKYSFFVLELHKLTFIVFSII